MPCFVVHEHHASHLHFDLRLEMDSVLKSFAIPKGPSMNPKDKRLAILVEDHPLSYGTFEGTIPEGEYGAGAVAIWDKGTYEQVSGSIDKGTLDLIFDGKKLKGAFVLTQLKDNPKNWLFFKKKDRFADAAFSLRLVLPEKGQTLKQTKRAAG